MARLAVDLPDEITIVLKNLCAAEKATKTAIIQRALRLYSGVRLEQGENDLSITSGGKVIKNLVMP